MRADDLQPGVARHVLFLQVHGAPADLLGAGVFALPGEQQAQLQVGVAGLGIQLDRPLELRDRGGEIALADPECAREALVRLPVVGLEADALCASR